MLLILLSCISPILLSILDIQNAVAAVFDCREIKGKGGVKLCYLESDKQNYHRKEKWVGLTHDVHGVASALTLKICLGRTTPQLIDDNRISGLYWKFQMW